MTVLVSHVGTCYLGVNVDIDAVREPELFDACLHQGFAMVLGLAQERWRHAAHSDPGAVLRRDFVRA